MILLFFQTGWEVTRTIRDRRFPEMWPFNLTIFMESSTWFYALIQVLLSLNVGVGVVPVVTGKFLYKGDAIK
jgi:solute carrier family 6 (neurotransmitter transporter)